MSIIDSNSAVSVLLLIHITDCLWSKYFSRIFPVSKALTCKASFSCFNLSLLSSLTTQEVCISGADPGGVMGVKRPPLPESYWESLKIGVVAQKCHKMHYFLSLASFQYFMRYNLPYLIWGCNHHAHYFNLHCSSLKIL